MHKAKMILKELNYIEKLGRLSEVNGEKDWYNDLYVKLIIDSTDAIADYAAAPVWLQKLMNAYADGNNTVFADSKGNIAYWHKKFIPRRNEILNWSKPVDGTTTITEWKGLHSLDEIVHVYNLPTGFIQNCNSTPLSYPVAAAH